MDAEKTVIYYTGHRENPAFESRIQQTLLETAGDLPIISVSQKPINFGNNICVGEVGTSGFNAWRQLQIGAIEADTKFLCVAESDYLYPREYFDFIPGREDTFYIPTPLYVLFAQKNRENYFCLKPRGQEGAIVVGREFLLDRFRKMFDGLEMWGSITEILHLFGDCRTERFHTNIPTITFKTDNNLNQKTQHDKTSRCSELPYWGTSTDLMNKYMLGVQ